MGNETENLWRPGIPYQKWLMMQQDLITEEEKEAYRQQWKQQQAQKLPLGRNRRAPAARVPSAGTGSTNANALFSPPPSNKP
mgnify:FL=1